MISAADAISAGTPNKVVGSSGGFKSAKIDSREVRKGDLFFAIKGENADGHEFVKQAFSNGAKGAVVDRKWMSRNSRTYSDKLLIGVHDTVEALGAIAKRHRERFRVPVICIGGSNGKTTTKDLVAAVLSQKYKTLKTKGNLNNHLGLPMTLLGIKQSHEICVLEIGCNHFGEINYLCEIAMPDAGLITNIGKEHLEFFKDLRGVAKAEFELFDYLRQSGRSKLFLNLDDAYISKYSKKTLHENKITYSYGFDTDYRGRFLEYSKDLQPRIEIEHSGKKFEVQIATFGKHSVYNGLAATVVGDHFGVPASKIGKALKMFRPASSKRMEVIRHRGITIINDAYNSNPDSVKMGIETLMEAKIEGQRHAVLGDMLELGKASRNEHAGIGKLARKMGVRNLYTFGKESYETFRNAGGIENNLHFDEKSDLSALLKRLVKKGDMVYVKGSRGMKMEEIVNALTEK